MLCSPLFGASLLPQGAAAAWLVWRMVCLPGSSEANRRGASADVGYLKSRPGRRPGTGARTSASSSRIGSTQKRVEGISTASKRLGMMWTQLNGLEITNDSFLGTRGLGVGSFVRIAKEEWRTQSWLEVLLW
jgi:hypothetical protein